MRPRVARFCAGERKCVCALLKITSGKHSASARCPLLRWGTKMRPRFAHFCAGKRKMRPHVAHFCVREEKCVRASVKNTSGKHSASARWSKLRQESISHLRVNQNHIRQASRACALVKNTSDGASRVCILPAFTLGNENASAFCLLLRWGTKMRPRFAHFCVGEEKCVRALVKNTSGGASRVCALIKITSGKHFASAHAGLTFRR